MAVATFQLRSMSLPTTTFGIRRLTSNFLAPIRVRMAAWTDCARCPGTVAAQQLACLKESGEKHEGPSLYPARLIQLPDGGRVPLVPWCSVRTLRPTNR